MIGALLGYVRPDAAQQLKPLGDLFIKLVKMMIEPIIFTTVVVGIAKMGDLKQFGTRRHQGAGVLRSRFRGCACCSVCIVVNIVSTRRMASYSTLTSVDHAPASHGCCRRGIPVVDFLLHIIPETRGRRLRQRRDTPGTILLRAVWHRDCPALGARGRPSVELIDQLVRRACFRVIQLIMKFAPVGALGAMAFTVGKYGLGLCTNSAS